MGAWRGPCGHRHAGGCGEAADEGRGKDAARPRSRGLRREGVGVEAQLRQQHHPPAPSSGNLGRLESGGLHHGPQPHPGREGGLRAHVRQGQDLPQRTTRELVLPAAHRPLRYR